MGPICLMNVSTIQCNLVENLFPKTIRIHITHLVGLVGLMGQVGQVGLVGMVGMMSLVDLVGQVALFVCCFPHIMLQNLIEE